MWVSAFLGLVLATDVPLWLTFEVANRRALGGHGILHLEDVIGPDQRRDIPRLPQASAVLLFSARSRDCGAKGFCADIADWTRLARQAGGLVVAVILTEADRADQVRSQMATSELPIAIAIDAYGVGSAVAGLDQPGTFVLIDSKGASRRWTPRAGRARVTGRTLDRVRAAFDDAAGAAGRLK